MKTGYILGINRGHNASACLLKDGEIIFSIEEERLSRVKYDGSPFTAMYKTLEYTDKIDYLVISGTRQSADMVEWTGDDIYTGLARKLGLIDRKSYHKVKQHPQVINIGHLHHKCHAALAFYRSGFETATAVIVDGAGSSFMIDDIDVHEVESAYECSYPANFKTIYKHMAASGNIPMHIMPFDMSPFGEEGECEVCLSTNAGIVKTYEAVTEYCGWQGIEAGKTMGLFPYGKPNNKIPKLFLENTDFPLSDKNVICPNYPQTAKVNQLQYIELAEQPETPEDDLTLLKSRRDLAYAVQVETQEKVLQLILEAVKNTGNKNVVLSGGYALNCVANYYYLNELNKQGINLYVEPMSNDAGNAIGAALMVYHELNDIKTNKPKDVNLYLGPPKSYDLQKEIEKYNNIIVEDADEKYVVQLLREKNIVAIFQGRSENGPRALGNRSILFDPTFEDGKEYVNTVKKREYFRPFAATVLAEYANEWFDLRGMKDSPTMMYAVNCKEGVAKKVPSVIHVDGTCRIQTVTKEQNLHFYNLIKTFNEETKVPMLFNTSFNLGGDPLVESLEDAINTLQKSMIQYLYLPEYKKMIVVKNIYSYND